MNFFFVQFLGLLIESGVDISKIGLIISQMDKCSGDYNGRFNESKVRRS